MTGAAPYRVAQQPSLFALGRTEVGAIVQPGWSSLILSTKSRDELLSGAARTAKLCFVVGGVATGVGAVVGVVSTLIA